MDNYKIVNGTFYHNETSDKVISVLEKCRINHIRIMLNYGDVKTGKSWNETHDITGYIGRSNGNIKVPILLYNNKSIGGGSILDNCIIEIKSSNGKRLLYNGIIM